MFLCATLVNDSTKERVFEWKDGPKKSTPTLYVVQPGNQVVGDQTFDPFLFSKPIKRYMTSWKVTQSSDSNAGARKDKISFKSFENLSEEISVLVATVITTLGFALQFVGLRAMHSVVSLLQLAVTLLMSVVRALLRTQRLSIDENVLRDRPDEVSGHELDWMALQIARGANGPRYSWSVTAQIPMQHPQSSSESVSNKAWEYRARLAELTGQSASAKSKLSNAWGNDLVTGRLQAQQLKKAIEGSLAILEDHAKVGTDIANFSWILNVAIGDHGETSYQTQSIKVHFQQLGSIWTVDSNLLEGIIGLWSWSIISDPRTEEVSFGFKTSTAADKPMYRVVVAGTKDEMERAWREIQFWIERPNIPLSKFNIKGPRSLSNSKTNVTMILGKDGQILADEFDLSTPVSISNPYQRLFNLHGFDIRKGSTIAATRIESKHIPTSCSQDIYQYFLCTIAAYLDFEKEAVIVTGSTMRLEHQLVTKLIDCFEASGLGSRQDASLVIIPALQNHAVLPRPTNAIPSAYRIAENFRKSSKFKEAEEILRWAWGVMTELGELRDMTLIELGELYRYALFSDRWQEFGKTGISWMGLQENHSVSSLENEVIARYVELEKRPRESRTGQHVLDAMLRNDRNETLWSIGQLYRSETGLPTDEESGRSVLSFLCQKGWFELVRSVLEIGSIVDSADKQGRTPLSYAAEHGHSSIVSILMEASALPITEDSSRRSPLSYASGNGHVSVMEKLLSDPRVNLDSKDIQNRSPLHWAAANCHKDAVECLIDHGAQANAKDVQNRSPLHWAAENGIHDAIGRLVNHGARVDDVDSNEYTPLLAALLNTRRSRFNRRQTADILVQMESKLDLIIQNKELWEWALENGEFVCAEYVLENHPRNDLGVMACIVTPPLYMFNKEEGKDSLFPLPRDFQSGFKLRIFHDQIEEEKIKLKGILSVAKGDFSIEVLHVNGGSQDWAGESLKKYKIIDMFLDELQDPGAIEKLARAAVTNGIDGKGIMSIICDRYELQFQLTEDVIEAALTNRNSSREIIELLLDRLGDQVPITEYVVARTAALHGNHALRIMQLFLDRRGDQLPITENVVKAAASNIEQGKEMIGTLFYWQGDQVPITEDVVKAAVTNRSQGKRIIELLLNRRGDQILHIEDVAKAVAYDEHQGLEMMELFLHRLGDQVPITEDVVVVAAGNAKQGRQILEEFLDWRGHDIPITENVVKAAAINSDQRREIIELLLERRRDLDPTIKEMLSRIKS